MINGLILTRIEEANRLQKGEGLITLPDLIREKAAGSAVEDKAPST
jgi:hypothetical protein